LLCAPSACKKIYIDTSAFIFCRPGVRSTVLSSLGPLRAMLFPFSGSRATFIIGIILGSMPGHISLLSRDGAMMAVLETARNGA